MLGLRLFLQQEQHIIKILLLGATRGIEEKQRHVRGWGEETEPLKSRNEQTADAPPHTERERERERENIA